MRRICLIAALLVSTCCLAQQVETARYEVSRWGRDQDCYFESFRDAGGMMVVETEKTDETKQRLWEFVTLDTSLYDLQHDLIPLPDRLTFFGSGSSSRWAAFIFLDEKQHKSDSVAFWVVAFDRSQLEFNTFTGKLPERSVLQSMALIDGTLMLSVNNKGGGGNLVQYDLDHHWHRTLTPQVGDDFILFHLATMPDSKEFVLAVREFADKRYKATVFFVYSREGLLVKSHRFENGENTSLGRMCFAFDAQHQLMVYSTLESEGGKKVSVEGMTEDFSKEAIGVTWIKFAASGTQSKIWLFKDLPDIGEAFQCYTPRLTDFAGRHVLAVEAFQPVYHTETRMEYGHYGFYRAYPVNYTVFDGFDFFGEVLLVFDDEGELQWHTSLKFENALCAGLYAHVTEAVVGDELLVASPGQQTLRYTVFDEVGVRLWDQEVMPLDYLYRTDSLEDEYEAGIIPWYGSRFLIRGCQQLQNPSLRATRRTVFYVQKIQYE